MLFVSFGRFWQFLTLLKELLGKKFYFFEASGRQILGWRGKEEGSIYQHPPTGRFACGFSIGNGSQKAPVVGGSIYRRLFLRMCQREFSLSFSSKNQRFAKSKTNLPARSKGCFVDVFSFTKTTKEHSFGDAGRLESSGKQN